MKDCDGTVRVISTIHWSSTSSQQVSLQCKLCDTVEKRGYRSFFSYGKLWLTKMVMLTFGIVVGIPYKMLSHFGLHVNKNTCTRYVEVIALVIGEKLERDRLNPNKKFLNSQADEVAFGSRKYYHGR